MTLLLTGRLEVNTEKPVQGEPIWIQMTITNDSDQEVVMVSPDVGVPLPDLNWIASEQAYQIALLMSLGLLKIVLKNSNGQLVESKGLVPWVTPILGKRTLQPHDNLTLDFDLSELFSINSAGIYTLYLRYGDDTIYAEASTDIEIGRHDRAEG